MAVEGVGINDTNRRIVIDEYTTNAKGKRVQKRLWICPYYNKWQSMLTRCYSEKHKKRHPTYVGCECDSSWLYFSNFIKWVDSQPNRDWMNCHLDKDLLIKGNKLYNEQNCVFLNKTVNSFITAPTRSRGEFMIGVNMCKRSNKFISHCSEIFGKKSNHLGTFTTELAAHKAWQAKKHEHACQLAELQDDPRVAQALRERYAPDKDWTDY